MLFILRNKKYTLKILSHLFREMKVHNSLFIYQYRLKNMDMNR